MTKRGHVPKLGNARDSDRFKKRLQNNRPSLQIEQVDRNQVDISELDIKSPNLVI